MLALLAASLVWAFSFGLIKSRLAGLDPAAVACARMLLAAAAFLPWTLRGAVRGRVAARAAALGAVQFGVMYVLYLAAYRWLAAWLVALFTIFTPLYVVLLADLRAGRLGRRHATAALLAVAGAAVVAWRARPSEVGWPGVVLLQGANLCFAWGQLRFADLRRAGGGSEASLLGWMYLGAAAVTAAAALVVAAWRGAAPWAGADAGAGLAVAYLGLVPTALGFYLWNKGAARTPPGALAAANNLKVPLGVVVAWTVFGEQAAVGRALLGLALVALALLVARERGRARPYPPPPASDRRPGAARG